MLKDFFIGSGSVTSKEPKKPMKSGLIGFFFLNFLPPFAKLVTFKYVKYKIYILGLLAGIIASPFIVGTINDLVIGFPEPATPIMEGIIAVHNYIQIYLILILIMVLYMIGFIFYNFYYLLYFPRQTHHVYTNRIIGLQFRRYSHNATLEIIWTVIPGIILILIIIPSFVLLYIMDACLDPSITFKAIGNQWYWSYEYGDYANNLNEIICFDSNLVPERDLKKGQRRLLQVDHPVILPTNLLVRVIITGSDVIHAWSVPSFGVKADGIPGRLNQASIFIKREGVFYGQCSELCGTGHGFMPIMVKGVDTSLYITWVEKKLALIKV